MTKKYKLIAVLIILFLGLLVFLEATKPNPVNWYSSYGNTDKIPYGLAVFHTTLKERMGEQFLEVNEPPFEFLRDSSEVQGTYLFINEGVYFDEAETYSLLDWVEKGNTMYVASQYFSQELLDTLSLETDYYYDLDNFDNKPLFNFTNPNLKRENPYSLDLEISANYFSALDTTSTVVLGVYDLLKKDSLTIEEPKVNFIKQPYGEGFVYLHFLPEAYTNYFILHKDNQTYTNTAQLYIPEDTMVYWDNHYKNSKTYYGSPLYLIFKNRYLKWAWYVLLIGVFLWVFFEGKRKQKAIPVVKPLQNQTLAYTHTIAGMYLEKGDHKSIAQHQTNHFLEYLRSTHNLDTSRLGQDFITKAAAKTGNSEADTKRLVDTILYLQQKENITQEELTKFNKRIEEYKR